MKIGIDIDDTITNTTKVNLEYVKKYDKEYNNKLLCNFRELTRGNFCCDEIKEFFKKYSLEINSKVNVKTDAAFYINNLFEEGNEIYIITARTSDYFGDVEEYCKNLLAKYKIKYTKIITGKLHKVQACIEEGIELMIDDSVDTCKEMKENNIDVLLFNSDVNIQEDTQIHRVFTWKEAYEYIHQK